MSPRWMLSRGGILNVYQYDDEVLCFAGGRLLLRGVNGSGKSTAMNMLLPFLLDGDTRRIDAAGEQIAVLKSWMLTGRDDAQPIGYLWLEMERGDEHLSFGCGIKANRASDTVTTWWFVTGRRPHVDLSLVEGRTPLTMEGLRSELGSDPVFRHDQRSQYRAELRSRLYGGADLDQHIRLLHIVRNPRVGDRIDLELPGHLHDALPALSDQAIQDAAQPLDELEEHRRNVGELTRTAATLDGLCEVYADYARGELLRRAVEAKELVDAAAGASRAASRAAAEATVAADAVAAAERTVTTLEEEAASLRTEIEALEDSPAYAAGRDLEDLRAHVATLARMVADAEAESRQRVGARTRAEDERDGRRREAAADHTTLLARMGELSAVVVDAGLPVEVPDLPRSADPAADGPAGGAPGGGGTADGQVADDQAVRAADPADRAAPVRDGMVRVRTAVNHRRGDLAEVRSELGLVATAERKVGVATAALESARIDDEARREAHRAARSELTAMVDRWREALERWLDAADLHRADAGLEAVERPGLEADLARRRHDVTVALARVASEPVDHHRQAVARWTAARELQQADVTAAEERLSELEAATLPPPPGQTWQRADRAVVFAETVEFRGDLGEQERAGLEAAMEAAGLLGAEVGTGGELVAGDGTLAVRPGAAADRPLSQHLVVSPDLDASVDAEAVGRLLASISTDDGLLDDGVADDGVADTVVTLDGRFRVGRLQGHHHKAEAEHVGVAARRAALERRRIAAREDLAAARRVLAATDAGLDRDRARLAQATALAGSLPDGREVDRAGLAVELAAATAEAAAARVEERTAAWELADSLHAEAVDKARRVATNLGLPADEDGLVRVARTLEQVEGLSRSVEAGLTVWVRSLAGWDRAETRWRESLDEERRAAGHLDDRRRRHDPEAARLATVEDSIGVAYEEILQAIEACRGDAETNGDALAAARTTATEAATRRGAADTQAEQRRLAAAGAAGACVAALPGLRAALAVPGLVEAASEDAASLRTPVEETPAGVGDLVARLETVVAPPGRTGVTAETVRQSLRQRRDALGAGWDAEDRQPDERLPLSIEVTGPAAQLPLLRAAAAVRTQLQELTSLLSAEQDEALRNLLQGLVAREVAEKLHVAGDLVARMNGRLDAITTTHGIGVSLRWRRKDDLAPELVAMIDLLARPPDLRTRDEDVELRAALSSRLDEARRDDPDAPYRDLVGTVLDYRGWYDITVVLRRPGRPPERLTRRSALSEGEKKVVCYLPLFAAVAASCDSLADRAPDAPRFVLLDDAFAKVSEDNHPKLFGLLVDLDLDFIATSERLWGTHATVPDLAITEVIRDAGLGVIVMEHSRWQAASGLTRC